MKFLRRTIISGALGLAASAMTGCAGNRRQETEDWLRSRPWVASVERVEALGGPVPLPGPVSLTAWVRCVPGTDRAALDGIRTEIEEYAASKPGDIQSLTVNAEHDLGVLPISGTHGPNAEVFALLDLARADSRARRIEIERDSGLELRVTTDAAAVLALAEDLTAKNSAATPTIYIRDADETAVIATAFGQSERVRTMREAVAAAEVVRGFEAYALINSMRLTVQLDSLDRLEPTFRTLRRRWPESELDLTVEADRLGLRGPESVVERLPAALALVGAAPFRRMIVQDNDESVGRITLVARVDDSINVARAARAVGEHPNAGGAAVWFLLDPIGKVRLVGPPALVAACGGPAQAVLTGPGSEASADNTHGRLRLYPDIKPPEFEAMCRAIRDSGWPGTLDFEVNGGSFTVAYQSTPTGRAANVEVVKTIGTIDNSTAWINAWDATATE